jgi:hypothetical protein
LQEKKMRFEAEVKETVDDEVKTVKWDGGDLKVSLQSLLGRLSFRIGVVYDDGVLG